ncbi:ABC-type transport system involved in resistance to organic solvents periplasmic component [Paramagnetospirillum magnetotacticum MS-1]|uniref:ABC-type transport system involved in resistance to organic solvents periplasmic component n=1 Tax=Paramagnetospirillum magnetotacticum MS-1 TaxID=272627 RepID=A0A0C2YU48_PARME|nr:MlaD family protein [Paramagnetospirillum magnetotacticum]KIL98225.1 ABC-type transport system involved in resistance to organic solvents periplasmic component [Paramagnetospirillum magnetotacticum MS-1]
MKDSRINYAMVGGFVLAMLVSLVVVVVVLTGRTGATENYYTRLANVAGIKYGTKVTFEGFPVGQVEKISPVHEGNTTAFRLEVSVASDWRIPKDSLARVAASGLLAAVTLDIKGGTSPEMLAPGADIPSGPAANIFAAMNDMAGQITDLNQTALKPLLFSLTQQVGSLGVIMEKHAPELMANLLAVTQDLAAKTPRITADVEKMTGTLSGKVVTDANAERIKETLNNAAQLSAGLQDSRKKVDAMLTSLDKSITGNQDNIDQSIKDLRHTLQAVSRSIDSVTYNLDGTTRNLHEFSRQIRDNPGVLIGGNKRGEDGPGRK